MTPAMRTPDWQSDDGAIQLHCCDCAELLPTIEAGAVDAVVTDPPYGISYNHEESPQSKHVFSHRRNLTPVANDEKPFDPSPWLQFKRLVLWGANCYADRLPVNPAWLCWDKVTQNGMKLRIGEMELAWARPLARPQVFRHLWSGAYRASEQGDYFHPTQKPIDLMAWCMSRVGAPIGCTIFDPYMGSGTTGVACVRTDRRFIGVELDESHFATAIKRIKRELAQPRLFTAPVETHTQAEMFGASAKD